MKIHIVVTGILFVSATLLAGQSPAGESTFVQNCAFCHGRDAGGGQEKQCGGIGEIHPGKLRAKPIHSKISLQGKGVYIAPEGYTLRKGRLEMYNAAGCAVESTANGRKDCQKSKKADFLRE